jgi:integrase
MLHDGYSVISLESRPERSAIERKALLNRKGQRGNVCQAHYLEKWNPQAPAYGRFWINVQAGGRERRTVSLGRCATQWVARLRLREYIERVGLNARNTFGEVPGPGTTFRQQAEWWIESVSIRRRRPVKPATIYGWQHCLDRWILPNLGKRLLSEVRNRALRQFVEILSAAGLAPKTIVNIVTVVKLVVASAVDEEGDQLHPRTWNHEFIQLPLVIKETQNRPTIDGAEITALLKSVKGRYATLVALVAGTGLRIGEALAVRTEDFDPDCHVLHVRRSVWHRREQAPKTANAIRLVDIPEVLAQVLRGYTEGMEGYLFTTRAGRVLDPRNALKALHGAGNRGGFHAFRRFRFSVLRRAGVPENLIKQWLGHSQNLMDLYAAQLQYDVAYRREWCETAGLGFELGELGYKSEAPIRPALVA